MRFAGTWFGVSALVVVGCAGRMQQASTTPDNQPAIAGVWDGVIRATITQGMGSGDTRIEKQQWHLTQRGASITGYYLTALTFVSGDGRPYVCSRQPQFSAVRRFDVAGRVRGELIELDETAQRTAQGHCDPGDRELVHYKGQLRGDTIMLIAGEQRQTLYRNREAQPAALIESEGAPAVAPESRFPSLSDRGPATASATPSDVSGVWVWEYRGTAPGGDEKIEREEWHVDQEGPRISGYYDRIVRQISSDGHAYRCSRSLEFEIATRYQIRGEVRGNQLVIYENSYEVLEPSECDNGKRRLDAYEGHASADEIRLIWGVGGQVLRRPRPDVPTQRF